jgi:hypothetical protein
MAIDPIRPSSAVRHKRANEGPHKSVRAVARLSVDVPEPLMRQLKIHAAQGGTTIQRIVLRLLNEELLR